MLTKSTKRITFVSLLISVLVVMAQNLYADFYVIPVNGKAKNIVHVAKTKGDFTDPVAAINSIIDASGNNPYVLMIGQGVYALSEPLQMKEYVSIIGSGGVTLAGAFGSNAINDSAVISGADNALLKDLAVVNTGNSTGYSIGMRNNGTSPTIIGVTFDVSGGEWNFGIDNRADSTPVLNNVTIYADGGIQTIGMYNDSSDPVFYLGGIVTTNGSNTNYGVYSVNHSKPVFAQVSIRASDSSTGANNYGVRGDDYSHTSLHNTQITITGGDNNYGVYSNTYSSPALNMTGIEVSGGVASNVGLRSYTGSNPVCSQSNLNVDTSLDSNCNEL